MLTVGQSVLARLFEAKRTRFDRAGHFPRGITTKNAAPGWAKRYETKAKKEVYKKCTGRGRECLWRETGADSRYIKDVLFLRGNKNDNRIDQNATSNIRAMSWFAGVLTAYSSAGYAPHIKRQCMRSHTTPSDHVVAAAPLWARCILQYLSCCWCYHYSVIIPVSHTYPIHISGTRAYFRVFFFFLNRRSCIFSK